MRTIGPFCLRVIKSNKWQHVKEPVERDMAIIKNFFESRLLTSNLQKKECIIFYLCQ